MAEVREIQDQYVSGLVNTKVSATIKWSISGVVRGDKVADAMMKQISEKKKLLGADGKQAER